MSPETIIAAFSVAVSAGSLAFAITSTRKTSIIQTITVQRMEWIKQSREALLEFAHHYHVLKRCEKRDEIVEMPEALYDAKARIESLMRRDVGEYKRVLTHLDKCLSEGYTDENYRELIGLIAYILARAWQRVKLDGERRIYLSNEKFNSAVTNEVDSLLNLALTDYYSDNPQDAQESGEANLT